MGSPLATTSVLAFAVCADIGTQAGTMRAATSDIAAKWFSILLISFSLLSLVNYLLNNLSSVSFTMLPFLSMPGI